MENLKKIALYLLLPLLAVSSVLPYCIRYGGWDFDLYGALIGVLGVYTTLLLGWQIFSSLNSKNEIEKIKKEAQSEVEKIRKDVQSEMDRVKEELRLVKAQAYCNEALQFITFDRPIPAFASYMKAAYYLTSIKRFGLVDMCFTNMGNIVNTCKSGNEPEVSDLGMQLCVEVEGKSVSEFLTNNLTGNLLGWFKRLSRFKTGGDLWLHISSNNEKQATNY